MQQLDEDYEIERQRRAEDLQLQIQDRRNALDEEIEAQKEALAEAQAAAKQNYDEQREDMKELVRDKLADAWGLADKLRDEVYPRMLEDAERFMEQYRERFLWPEEQEAVKEEQEEALDRLTRRSEPTWIGSVFGGAWERVAGPLPPEAMVPGTTINPFTFEVSIAPNVVVSGLVGLTEEELNRSITDSVSEGLSDFADWLMAQTHGLAGLFQGR